MSEKRRLITQLPGVHQTETLRRFFGATVDVMFQPGKSEPFSGYIGQKPSYYIREKDFYVREPTEARAAYQLEATMVQLDADGNLVRALPYEDLIGYLGSIGVDTSNHERLFEADAYGWVPPIDLDKFLNFRLYRWIGDEAGYNAIPRLPLVPPMRALYGDGTTVRFPLPAPLPGSVPADDLPVVLVCVPNSNVFVWRVIDRIDANTVEVLLDTSPANQGVAPPPGSLVLTIRHSDLRTLLRGKNTFDISSLTLGDLATRTMARDGNREYPLPAMPAGGQPAVLLRSGPLDAGRLLDESEHSPAINGQIILTNPPDDGLEVIVFRDRRLATLLRGKIGPMSMPRLSSGMRVAINDASILNTAADWQADTVYFVGNRVSRNGLLYEARRGHRSTAAFNEMLWRAIPQGDYVDGIGRSIRLTPDAEMNWNISAQHITIERGSRDRNPWSTRNHWVHRDSFSWANVGPLNDRKARRPIIEFQRDMRLYGYGYTGDESPRLPDVDAIVRNGEIYAYDFDLVPLSERDPLSDWQPDTAYLANAVVIAPDPSHGGVRSEWRATLAHTSSATTRPGVGAVWQRVKDVGEPGGYDRNGAIPLNAAGLWPLGSVFADNGHGRPVGYDDAATPANYHALAEGERILVMDAEALDADGTPLIPETLRNRIYTVGSQDRDGVRYLVLTPDSVPVRDGQIVSVRTTGKEYTFVGNQWRDAPVWTPNVEPRFTLFDADGVALDDPGRYPFSDFATNRSALIFAYARSETASPDPVLGIPLRRDARGNIMFESTIATERVTYGANAERVLGLYRYQAPDGSLKSVWQPLGRPISQPTVVVGRINPDALSPGDAFLIGTSAEDAVRVVMPDSAFGNRSLPAVVGAINTVTASALPMIRAEVRDGALLIRNQNSGTIFLGNASGTPLDTLGFTAGLVGVPIVALNLQANPDNEEVTFVTRGDIFEQFSDVIAANIGSDGGEPFDANLYRDSRRDLAVGNTRILQHRAPLLRLMLSVANNAFDIPEAVRWGEREYSRWRAKFIRRATELRSRGTIRDEQAVNDRVLTILDAMRVEKGAGFPFANSPMGGGGWFIPTTPAAMGLLPVYTPAKFMDTTQPVPAHMLRGHDGSLTPAYDDWRDDMLLGVEQLIYGAIPDRFKGEVRPAFDLDAFISNVWSDAGTNGYGMDEMGRAIAVRFEQWAQTNAFDYRENTTYESTDAFSWNYRGLLDRYGNPMPGGWRAIYRLYYDTDRPHEAPWEMLGFSGRPVWWEAAYGPAPYTSGNLPLWRDLMDGIIRFGPRAGRDARYERPGLLDVLPVDEAGTLRDPISIGIIAQSPTAQQAQRNWIAGDIGPIEALFWNSPAFGFAKVLAGFMLKPARQVELGWDTLDTGYEDEQWVRLSTGDRPRHSAMLVHGELDGGNTIVVAHGIQNWITERLISTGQQPVALGGAVRGLNVRLAHKVAGFTSRDDLRVVADDFGLVPAEDVSIALHQSPVTRSEVYSGVILEWNGAGWRVVGYDARDPFFTIMPGDPNGRKEVIGLTDAPEPVINPWRPNTFYSANMLVAYRDSNYRALRSHTSSGDFEQSLWTVAPGIDQTLPRVNRYISPLGTVERVPYGTVFATRQEVADLLFGYERWLISRGWTFDAVADGSDQVRDWKLVLREFMNWSLLDWAPGHFIALSPGAEELRFQASSGAIIDVERASGGFYGLLDRSGQPIERRTSRAGRLDGTLTLRAPNADIFAARVGLNEVEHLLVFSNKTIFSDIIYAPLFNLRQPRLRVAGRRTTDWSGRPDAAGFVLVEDRIVPSFEKAADDVRYAFGIEEPDRADLRSYARHLTGFQTRPYLSNLLLSDTEQFEFHQGLVQAKGSPSSFDRLLRSSQINQNRDLRFLEEWAFRMSRFGLPQGPVASLLLRDSDVRQDPQFIRLRPLPPAPPGWIGLAANDERWVERPSRLLDGPEPFFPLALDGFPEALPSPGPIRLSEVNYTTLADIELPGLRQRILEAGSSLNTGDRIWSYGPIGQWQVWRVSDLLPKAAVDGEPNTVVFIAPPRSTLRCRIRTSRPHGLTMADVGSARIIIDSLGARGARIDGVWIVQGIPDDTRIEIEADVEMDTDYAAVDEDKPIIRVFRPTRFADGETRAASIVPFEAGELTYLDSDGNGRWLVERLTDGQWAEHRREPRRVDPTRIKQAVIHDLRLRVQNNNRGISEPQIGGRLNLLDPMAGIIAGVADRELSYKVDYDPAVYEGGEQWGEEQVGKLWWDTSAVRFLDPYTDEIGQSATRDTAEIEHRTFTWSRLAPGTRVDVYEWVEADVPPSQWNSIGGPLRDGTPFALNATPFIVRQVYDPQLDRDVTRFFFWVRDKRVVPALPNRRYASAVVASIIESPSVIDLPWVAPITNDGLLVGGLTGGLNDSTTALRIMMHPAAGRRVDGEWQSEGVAHDEWVLLRANDERSQPPEWMWRKLCDSLTGFEGLAINAPRPAGSPEGVAGPFQCFAPLPAAEPGTKDDILTNRWVGVEPGQSMIHPFADGSGRLAARRSLIQMLNTILSRSPVAAERDLAVRSLDRADELSEWLFWIRPDDSNRLELPATDYDLVVHTREDLDRLKNRSPSLRILLDRTAEDVPQWSIWSPTPQPGPNETREADFVLAAAYDILVADMAGRDNLTDLAHGTRVAVESDAAFSGFWTIWRFDPQHKAADARGFVLLRMQRYRTADFYTEIDWYAEGFSVSAPPVVTYANAAERNAAEGSNPNTIFVRLNDDGAGRWVWTSFEEGGWRTVARERGTIRLSDLFYSPNRLSHGIGAPSTENISRRDGAWELRVLFDALRSAVLTASETNELFFSMLHFIHSQQETVEWAFKTSFLSVAGYGATLERSPVRIADPTEDLLAYINEVKPYRVKTRDILRRYSTVPDEVPVGITDFDKPPYLDANLNRVRILDEAQPLDAAILSERQGSWRAHAEAMRAVLRNSATWANIIGDDARDWYLMPAQALNPALSPIRRFNMTLRFDRTTMWGLLGGFDADAYERQPFDAGETATPSLHNEESPDTLDTDIYGTAINRIRDFYTPLPGMRPRERRLLLDGNFKGAVYDGGEVTVWTTGSTYAAGALVTLAEIPDEFYSSIREHVAGTSFDANLWQSVEHPMLSGATAAGTSVAVVNPDIDGRPGLQGRDPYADRDRPPERLVFVADDALTLRANTKATPGAPPMTQRHFAYPPAGTSTFPHSYIAESEGTVLVYRDGLRLSPNLYEVNHIAASVVHSVPAETEQVLVHAIHPGGSGAIHERYLRRYHTGRSRTYVFEPEDRTVIPVTPEVYVNGERLTSLGFTHQTLVSGGRVQERRITLTTAPANDADIVVVFRRNDGAAARMNTEFLSRNPQQQWRLSYRDTVTKPEHAGVIVEVDGLRLRPPPTFYGRVGDMSDPVPSNREAVIELDFEPTAQMTVQVFTRAANTCGTYSPAGNAPTVVAPNLATAMGMRNSGFGLYGNMVIAFGADLANTDVAVTVLDVSSCDYTVTNGTLSIHSPVSPSATIVVTTFSDAASMNIETRTLRTHLSGRYNMLLPRTADYVWASQNGLRLAGDVDFDLQDGLDANAGYDAYPLDAYAYDAEGITQGVPGNSALVMGRPQKEGDWIVCTTFLGQPAREASAWQASTTRPAADRPHQSRALPWWEHLRRNSTVRLAQPLGPNDVEIVVSFDPDPDVPRSLLPQNPLMTLPTDPLANPESDQHGLIWIGGERVEFGKMSRQGTTAILTGLRRTSRGTARTDEQREIYQMPANGSLRDFVVGAQGTIDVTVVQRIGLRKFGIWAKGITYPAGAPILHEGRYYRAATRHRSGARFDASLWTPAALANGAVTDPAATGFGDFDVAARENDAQWRSNRAIQRDVDYAVTVNGDGTTTITFRTAPAADEYVVIGVSSASVYPAGTPVYDGLDEFTSAPMVRLANSEDCRTAKRPTDRHAPGWRETLLP